ncbi:hypothetical protein Syun_022229 [Stephania yunnanensis]|uniref:Protein kinase domain-containing protein n=1 Tax=Stephania yunnanensis TaxID=152371 RepID=A0AAP0NPW7_9MAGN
MISNHRGLAGEIGFPFITTSSSSPSCGSFILNCTDVFNTKLQFSKQEKWYYVEHIDYSANSIIIRDPDLQSQLEFNRCDPLTNFTLPVSPSVLFKDASPASTFLKCKRDEKSQDSQQELELLHSLSNFTGCIDNYDIYFSRYSNISLLPLPERCLAVQLPASQLLYAGNKMTYGMHAILAESGQGTISYETLKYNRWGVALAPSPQKMPHISAYHSNTVVVPPSPRGDYTAMPTVIVAPSPRGDYTARPTVIVAPSPLGDNTAMPTVFVRPRPRGDNTGTPYIVAPPGKKNSSAADAKNLTFLLRPVFSLRWEVLPICSKCLQGNGGFCAEDAKGNIRCGGLKDNGRRRKIIIAILISVFAFFLLPLLVMLNHFSRKGYFKRTRNAQLFEDFLQNHPSLALQRFSYSGIKKMTKSFKEKLGQGGYGGVFKGKLLDGHLVAVKVLAESKGNGEEFINEVASISKTSHVNIVSLVGFCCERSKRALVYEFMPNGSLDKFIYLNSSNSCFSLSLETLYDIAIGIATGLAYLHSGCTRRIVHFDIKPHNILLDHNFCPKISDFGLAKLCTRKNSIISMQGVRGTVGYIAPELVLNYGGVSHKSDVYSYGMMVLEMVGARRNTDIGVSRTSDIYFPYWIYDHLEDDEAFRSLHGVASEEQKEIAKKMILVGLWCIQTKPPDRPSINQALEMLKGSLESLEAPPKPFLYSPERDPIRSSTT